MLYAFSNDNTLIKSVIEEEDDCSTKKLQQPSVQVKVAITRENKANTRIKIL